jgi:hypothetical protein
MNKVHTPVPLVAVIHLKLGCQPPFKIHRRRRINEEIPIKENQTKTNKVIPFISGKVAVGTEHMIMCDLKLVKTSQRSRNIKRTICT